MPTPLVVANAAQMRLIWSKSGALHALNVMGVVNAGSVAITQALTNTIGTAIKSALTTSALGAQLSDSFALATVGLRDIRTAAQSEFLDAAGPTAGTGAATEYLPPQTALCITLRTAGAGASYRGRVYLNGYVEGVNVGQGTISSTVASVAFVAGIKSALQANGLDLGVISRPAPLAVPARAGFISVVTSIVARDSVWDTQRRRAIPGI